MKETAGATCHFLYWSLAPAPSQRVGSAECPGRLRCRSSDDPSPQPVVKLPFYNRSPRATARPRALVAILRFELGVDAHQVRFSRSRGVTESTAGDLTVVPPLGQQHQYFSFSRAQDVARLLVEGRARPRPRKGRRAAPEAT